jgi:hypothetical protein
MYRLPACPLACLPVGTRPGHLQSALLVRAFVHLRHAGHVRRVRTVALECGLTAAGLGLGGPLGAVARRRIGGVNDGRNGIGNGDDEDSNEDDDEDDDDDDDDDEDSAKRRSERRDDSANASASASGGAFLSSGYGALALRFQLYQSTFCFVNCHLAAAATDVRLRNSDYGHVVRSIYFDTREPAEAAAAARVQRRQQRGDSFTGLSGSGGGGGGFWNWGRAHSDHYLSGLEQALDDSDELDVGEASTPDAALDATTQVCACAVVVR